MRFSKNPITVITANSEVQTKEEATVYVNLLDLFVTVKLLDDTPAVLSLGKLCEDHGYSYEWTSGQLPHLIKNDRRIQCNMENYVPIIVIGLLTGSFTSTSSTLLPQDSVSSTSSPTSTRSQNTSSPEWSDQLRESRKIKNTNEDE